MFYRRRLLLALQQTLDEPLGLRDFQKQLFLFTDEQPSPAYDFVPYRHGCYSFTAEADRRALIRSGILRSSQEWSGSPLAETMRSRFLPRTDPSSFGCLRGHSLVRQTYLKAPSCAARSESACEHLSKEELRSIKRPPPQSGPALFTIGCEGKSLEAFLCQLLDSGVHCLCDVRRNPVSRKPGFSSSKLSDVLSGLDIEYVHFPRLGISSGKRRILESAQDHKRLWADYAKEAPTDGRADVETVLKLLGECRRIALTCIE